MTTIKSLLFIIILPLSFLNSRAQSKNDSILLKKAETLDTADIKILIKKKYINETDKFTIGMYMVAVAQKNPHFHSMTIGQLLDSVNTQKNRMNNATAAKYNFGKDSVFIRQPNGDKFFMGMGQLSLEKLVARESLNLPEHYDGDYDLKVNSADVATKLSVLLAKSKLNWLIGNVTLIKRDSGELKNLRVGDLFEIADRISVSKEFAPFVDEMK